MRFLADENFPRPALDALRSAGWEIFSVAEECPGIADEEVAGLCSEGQRILLTFHFLALRALRQQWGKPRSQTDF